MGTGWRNISPYSIGSPPSIHPLLRNNPPHPAPRVLDVTPIPGDQVDVQVHHGLASGLADIHADVVAVRVELAVEMSFRLFDEGEQGLLLLGGGVKKICDMPEGDDQQVAGVHRVAVAAGIAEVVCKDDLGGFGVAERTGHSAHAS